MDWYSWLSKTNLDPYAVYEYGRTFTQNELQRADTSYFNHELLQSMGVSVAKHRLEILKHAKKSIGGRSKDGFSKLVSAITKTRTHLTKKFGRWVSNKNSVHMSRPETKLFRPQWPSSNLRKNMGFEETKEEKHKTAVRSGPLKRRGQESFYLSPKKVSSKSGPLDTKVQENLIFMYNSPMDSRPGHPGPKPLDGVRCSPKNGSPCRMMRTGGQDEGVSSFWSFLFQDIKPT